MHAKIAPQGVIIARDFAQWRQEGLCASERTPSASEMHHPLVAVGANENSAKSTAFALLAESLQFELVSGKSDEGDPWCSGVGNVCLCS